MCRGVERHPNSDAKRGCIPELHPYLRNVKGLSAAACLLASTILIVQPLFGEEVGPRPEPNHGLVPVEPSPPDAGTEPVTEWTEILDGLEAGAPSHLRPRTDGRGYYDLHPEYGYRSGDVKVDGHYRSDGTYVRPHRRTRPNSTCADNYLRCR